jgi:hypothetical protein
MSKVIPTVSVYYNAQFISKPKETQHNYIMNSFIKTCKTLSQHI